MDGFWFWAMTALAGLALVATSVLMVAWVAERRRSMSLNSLITILMNKQRAMERRLGEAERELADEKVLRYASEQDASSSREEAARMRLEAERLRIRNQTLRNRSCPECDRGSANADN